MPRLFTIVETRADPTTAVGELSPKRTQESIVVHLRREEEGYRL